MHIHTCTICTYIQAHTHKWAFRPDANICMSQHVNWSSVPATRPAVTSDASYAVRVIAKDQRSSSLLKLRDLASRLHQMQSSEVDPKLGWWIFIFPLASSIVHLHVKSSSWIRPKPSFQFFLQIQESKRFSSLEGREKPRDNGLTKSRASGQLYGEIVHFP